MNSAGLAIHTWATLVGGVLVFFLGGIWYGAIFNATRIRLMGYSQAEIDAMMSKGQGPVFGMLAINGLLIAVVVGVLTRWTGSTDVADGLSLGIALWAIAATAAFAIHISGNKPIGVFLIDTGYQFLYLVILSVLLSVWR